MHESFPQRISGLKVFFHRFWAHIQPVSHIYSCKLIFSFCLWHRATLFLFQWLHFYPAASLAGGVYPSGRIPAIKANNSKKKKKHRGERAQVGKASDPVKAVRSRGERRQKSCLLCLAARQGLFFSEGELKCLFPRKVVTRRHFVFKASASCCSSLAGTRRSSAV